MQLKIGLMIIPGIILLSCRTNTHQEEKTVAPVSITGTWKLISGTTIEKGDTTVTYYATKDLSFIKIINETHFAFLKHDLNKGKDSTAQFGAGGGTYSLKDNVYTEHLEYCNERQWETNDFPYTVKIKNDTLTISGIEKVEKIGVDRLNIEMYTRVKN